MKRFLLGLFTFTLVSFKCFSFPLVIPQKQVVHVFGIGTGEGKLVYRSYDPYEPFHPTCLLVSEKGNYFIADYGQKGILEYDRGFHLVGKIPTILTERMTLSNEYLLGWAQKEGGNIQTIVKHDSENKAEKQGTWSWGETYSPDYIFFDTPFFFTTSGLDGIRIWKVNDISVTSFKITEWLATIKSGLELTSDRQAIISPALGILSGSAADFFRLNEKPELQPPNDSGERDSIDYNNGQLFGIDAKGRRYYDVEGDDVGRLLVVDRSGNISVAINHRDGLSKTVFTSFPCITQNGDIYYIESSPKEHKLIKILCAW